MDEKITEGNLPTESLAKLNFTDDISILYAEFDRAQSLYLAEYEWIKNKN